MVHVKSQSISSLGSHVWSLDFDINVGNGIDNEETPREICR